MANQSRELRRRMKSIANTKKITKTMELVAASRLKKALDRVAAAKPYAEALRGVIADLVTPELAEAFPLLRTPAPPAKGGPRRAVVLLATSNRGLCGAFNANLIKEARRRVEELEAAGYQVELHGIGRKGIGFFKYQGRPMASERLDVGDKPTPEHATSIIAPFLPAFERGELASVDFVHAHYRSALSAPPTTTRVLPVETPAAAASGPRKDYLLEPDAPAILGALLPLYVRNMVYRGLCETAAGEQSARRTAMKSATDNAGELFELVKRTYNKGRQAAITQEIAEVVGGAAALG
ncbi:MAG: ATP synthase F1 subunit gamma [Gemmatimonadales bacterium]|nr:ATP synthase F1 subunit gamma [Gemmatimonadales bacterium]